jgi:hypothetical protein
MSVIEEAYDMAQLTIYLPDEVEKRVRRDARRAKKSVSAYIADLATSREGRLTEAAWAKEVARLYGSWVGAFPELDDPPPDEVESL